MSINTIDIVYVDTYSLYQPTRQTREVHYDHIFGLKVCKFLYEMTVFFISFAFLRIKVT